MNRTLSYFFDAFVLMAQDDYWREFKTKRNRSNICVILNGISVNPNPKKRTSHREQGVFTVGTISRLHAERKPWLYLELFSEIVKLDPSGKYAFVIGGEGLERGGLEQKAKDLGLNPIVTFTGLVEEPNEFLPMLDFYVSLNVEDTTGIAGLEAVFSGLPVVALQLSTEYSHGEDDWIWSSRDPSKLAEKIIELKSDSRLLQDLIERQFEFALTKFSSSRMTDEYLELYAVRR
jgi:glycosyltransferase involved in cell wall biosynthesis